MKDKIFKKSKEVVLENGDKFLVLPIGLRELPKVAKLTEHLAKYLNESGLTPLTFSKFLAEHTDDAVEVMSIIFKREKDYFYDNIDAAEAAKLLLEFVGLNKERFLHVLKDSLAALEAQDQKPKSKKVGGEQSKS